MSLKVFIVFHKHLDERLAFPFFSAAELASYFTYYAVADRYPRKVIGRKSGATELATERTAGVLVESKLPHFDPRIQERGFLETSCYVHILKNRLHEGLDYIGVTQYDMRWSQRAADLLRAIPAAPVSAPPAAYGIDCGVLMNQQGVFHDWAFPEQRDWNFLLASYNRFFGTNLDRSIMIDKPFTLYQTYLLPQSEFVALASWLSVLCDEVYPWAQEPPYETHWGALSGYAERAESLFIAARLHQKKIVFVPLPLEHDDGIASSLGVAKLHYRTAVAALPPGRMRTWLRRIRSRVSALLAGLRAPVG